MQMAGQLGLGNNFHMHFPSYVFNVPVDILPKESLQVAGNLSASSKSKNLVEDGFTAASSLSKINRIADQPTSRPSTPSSKSSAEGVTTVVGNAGGETKLCKSQARKQFPARPPIL
ncbi:hypothetical protein IHE45_19G075000 [Dioscorea alata]|uniref:Uncharacterized protein n=1 Tax=Dioscorea alata TaxID=55571 RepID=A0ACB7TZ68_DIOAL|nr:hypothetical protein IHE45_19G075000 [Dioscorea alata]